MLDHGDGPDAADATVDDIVADVVARARALDGSLTIVGHSFGAWVGGRALAALGERVSRYVGIAGLATVPSDVAERSVGFAAALESGQLTLCAAAGIACDLWLPATQRDPAHTRAIHALIEGDRVPRLCRVLRRHRSLGEPLRRVAPSSVPATILHATDDRGAPVASGRDLASCLAHADFIELPGDSHFLHWTHLAEVARRVFG